MFLRLSNWVFIGALACALSACGGGQADSAAGAAPAPLPAVVAAPSAAAPAAATAAAAGQAADVQLSYRAALDSGRAHPALAAQAQQPAQVALSAVQGGGSAVAPASRAAADAAAIAAAYEARLAELAAAEQAARYQAAQGQGDEEALLALVQYQENADRQAALSGVRRPHPSDPDCIQPRLLQCASN